MTLTIQVNGNSFSGTLTETTYGTEVYVSGIINGNYILFIDTSFVNGNNMALNCSYAGTLSNGTTINGNWAYPYPITALGGGSITLTKQS